MLKFMVAVEDEEKSLWDNSTVVTSVHLLVFYWGSSYCVSIFKCL